MKLNYHKTLAAIALGTVCALPSMAETVSQELCLNFEDVALGTKYNSFWGGPNDKIVVVEDPDGVQGNCVYVSGDSGENPDVWSTYARIPSISAPGGCALKDLLMVTVTYKATIENPDVPLRIQFLAAGTSNAFGEPVAPADEIVFNEWTTATFDAAEFALSADGMSAMTFGLAFGFNGSTRYYIDDITFYFEKEMTQRELDEAALDKKTAKCVTVDFEDMEANEAGCPHLGSNGGSTNRADMIVDMGPEGYNNKCAHIIYGGYTNIFIWNYINCPEGYTFDDLREVEYDIYETETPGVDVNTSAEFPGKNGAPVLKIKDAPWSIDSNTNGSDCGNAALPTVNEWHHVSFKPSGIAWAPRDFEITEGEGDDAVKTPVHWDAEQTCEEMGKKTSFAISIGFFPCLNQCYVDNVKLWFQHGANWEPGAGVDDVTVDAQEGKIITVYNLQGIEVMRTENEAEIHTLAPGLYVGNGKKYLVK